MLIRTCLKIFSFMSLSDERSFRIITHLAEVLFLEEEEFEELDTSFEIKFAEDFSLELEFLIHEKNIESRALNSGQKNDSNIASSNGFIKGLHRRLAIKTHPDKCGGSDEEFKDIQTAYEEGNVAKLLKAAVKYEIKLSIDEKDKEEISNQIRHKRQILEQKKQTVRWAWGASQEKTEEMKNKILGLLKLDEAKFKEWKKTKKP